MDSFRSPSDELVFRGDVAGCTSNSSIPWRASRKSEERWYISPSYVMMISIHSFGANGNSHDWCLSRNSRSSVCLACIALGCRGTTCIETLTYYTSSWLWWVSKKKKGKLVRQHWLRLVTSSFFFAHISGIKRETLTDHADNLTDDWYFKRIPRVYFLYTSETNLNARAEVCWRSLTFFLPFFSFLTHRFLPSF